MYVNPLTEANRLARKHFGLTKQHEITSINYYCNDRAHGSTEIEKVETKGDEVFITFKCRCGKTVRAPIAQR